MTYGCQIWGQSINESSKMYLLQKKAIRIISFANFRASSNPLFRKLQILKLPDIIKLMNLTFVHNVLNAKMPNFFKNFIKSYEVSHSYKTVRNPISNYSRPDGSVVASISGKNKSNPTLSESCALTWNCYLKLLSVQKLEQSKPDKLKPNWLQNISINELKNIFKTYVLRTYQ